MADYEEEIPDAEKVKIASDFILHAPPGEFNEVFNDVRVLLNNDQLLKEGASAAFQQYNELQFTPVKLEGSDEEALVTAHGLQADGRYIDNASKQTFAFDHLRKEASDLAAAAGDGENEGLRVAIAEAAKEYCKDHYPAGVSSTFSKDGCIIMCIEDHKFNPANFWNGRWRSQWSVNASTGEVTGTLRVQVHYYEDGNVQLVSVKEEASKVAVGDAAAAAKALIKAVSNAENVYQTAISQNYNAMSDTVFKALRRALPITRTKLDWNKILNYKLGKELSSK